MVTCTRNPQINECVKQEKPTAKKGEQRKKLKAELVEAGKQQDTAIRKYTHKPVSGTGNPPQPRKGENNDRSTRNKAIQGSTENRSEAASRTARATPGLNRYDNDATTRKCKKLE